MSNDEAKSWLPVSDLEVGFNENKLPATADLVGREFDLRFADRRSANCSFLDKRKLSWQTLDAFPRGDTGIRNYEAACIAPDIYFVDVVNQKHTRTSTTLALDLKHRVGLVIESTVPTRREANLSFLSRMERGLDLSPMKVDIARAYINQSVGSPCPHGFERTEELISKRIRWVYSRQHAYEHIYVNHRFYTWQCLKGPEKGTVETDSCDYFKVVPQIYLFIWREKVVPTVGIVFLNLKEKRSHGKIFGLDLPTGKPVNFTMGAFGRIMT